MMISTKEVNPKYQYAVGDKIGGEEVYEINGNLKVWSPSTRQVLLLGPSPYGLHGRTKTDTKSRIIVNTPQITIRVGEHIEGFRVWRDAQGDLWVFDKLLKLSRRVTAFDRPDRTIAPHTPTPAKRVKRVVIKKKPIVETPATLKFSDGRKAILRGDGKIWEESESYGAKIYTPIKAKDMLNRLAGQEEAIEDLEPTVIQIPDVQWRPPDDILAPWIGTLLQFKGEALCIYGKIKVPEEGKPIWQAVVPIQKAGGAAVDVDEFAPSQAKLSSMGYKRVGTIHTHPGGGVCASGTDLSDELFGKFGGIHIIASRTGEARFYMSANGVTWVLSALKTDVWNDAKMDIEVLQSTPTMMTERGGKKIKKVVKDFVQPVVKKHTYTAPARGTKASDLLSTRDKEWERDSSRPRSRPDWLEEARYARTGKNGRPNSIGGFLWDVHEWRLEVFGGLYKLEEAVREGTNLDTFTGRQPLLTLKARIDALLEMESIV